MPEFTSEPPSSPKVLLKLIGDTSIFRAGVLVCVGVGLAAVSGCRHSQVNPAAVAVAPDPESDGQPLADISDLEELRNRAAKGEVTAVRNELVPRLDRLTQNRPDAGRDALRRFAIELALVQGDTDVARYQLGVLEADFRHRGEAALPREAAVLLMLGAELRLRDGDVQQANQMCLHALELVGDSTSGIRGDVLRVFARAQLALSDPDQAMLAVEQALVDHSRVLRHGTLIDLHEDQLLRVEVLMAQRQPVEAVIAAGDLYHGAVDLFGPDTLPHAEALVMASAASLASGDRSAAQTFFTDAEAMLRVLQFRQGGSPFPVSQRLHVRIQELTAALAEKLGDDRAP